MNKPWWTSRLSKWIFAIITGIVIGVAVLYIWDRVHRIDIDLVLHDAYNFKYANGKTYKDATVDDGIKIVDKLPVPLNTDVNDKKEQSIVFGVVNNGLKTIDDVMFWIKLPVHFNVTSHQSWTKGYDGTYHTQLGSIHNKVVLAPINFTMVKKAFVKKTGFHPMYYGISFVDYDVSRRDIRIPARKAWVYVYETTDPEAEQGSKEKE